MFGGETQMEPKAELPCLLLDPVPGREGRAV